MAKADVPGFAAIELRERAVSYVSERGEASEDEVLAHVYGGSMPVTLRAQLAEPLLADPRLERGADGAWRLRSRVEPKTASDAAFTALALVATGPSPLRARVARVCAMHVERDEVIERFDALVNPSVRVPRYALARLGLEVEVLEAQPPFAEVFESFERFIGRRPVLMQDAQLTWAFLAAEARRLERVLVEPPLLDVNQLAEAHLPLKGKPSLSLVAAHLGISSIHIVRPDEEARVLGLVGSRLLGMSVAHAEKDSARALRRASTASALPDEPGVYVLRDREQTALYVGKARRLRSRVAAYIHRPLGATRRLEGLVGAVEAVDTTTSETDLEALVLEDREIRRLQPRFNTVRQQRTPRYWIRLPPQRVSARGRALAPPRLELSAGPASADGEFIGPFRNEALADQARQLARSVFELDILRDSDTFAYRDRLAAAWRFLSGSGADEAEALARAHGVAELRRVLAFDVRGMLLPFDPRVARCAVIRPAPVGGLEGFVLDHAVLSAWHQLEDDDVYAFARALLAPTQPPRTAPEDADVVLRWFGAQRPSARFVHLPDDALAAADALEAAVHELVVREA